MGPTRVLMWDPCPFGIREISTICRHLQVSHDGASRLYLGSSAVSAIMSTAGFSTLGQGLRKQKLGQPKEGCGVSLEGKAYVTLVPHGALQHDGFGPETSGFQLSKRTGV